MKERTLKQIITKYENHPSILKNKGTHQSDRKMYLFEANLNDLDEYIKPIDPKKLQWEKIYIKDH